MAINATAVWRVRPSGSNTNGGGYDSAISGAGTDYSQQNSAQLAGSDGAASGTTTFTGSSFTSQMVGNAMYVTGGGLTTGWYFITAFTNSTTITIDRSPGTGSAATYNVGGGWADPWTNLQTTTSGVTSGSFPVVGSNIVYVLGSGIPNPSSYTDDYTLGGGQTNWVVGSQSTGNIIIDNDPATPSYQRWPSCLGGMPVINCNSNVFFQTFNSQWVSIRGLWLRQPTSATVLIMGGFRDSDVRGLVFDSKDNICEVEGLALGCEVFYSGTPATGATVHVFQKSHIVSCYIHDYPGLGADNSGPITNSIFRKCGNGAIKTGGNSFGPYSNNTIDATTGTAIEYASAAQLTTQCFNNIITNTSSVAISATFGSTNATANTNAATLIDSNVFYNNTTNFNNFVSGPHDTVLGASPYVNQSTGDYTLA